MVLDTAGQELLFTHAASAHSFTDEAVTDAELEAVYDLVKWAPTATNQQPLGLVVVRGTAKDELAEAMFDENAAQVRSAPVVLVVLSDATFAERLPELWPIFPAAADVFFPTPESRVASARFNTALQMGYLILGIRARGLAAGPMTGFDLPRVQQRFGDADREVLGVIAVGHPAPDAYLPRLPRRSFADVARIA